MLRTLRWLMFVVLLVAPGLGLHGETVDGLPAPTGYVNDFAGVLSPETRQSVEDLCTQVDQKEHAQIAVVTVKTIDPDKTGATPSIEEFATALEDKWKVLSLIHISHGSVELDHEAVPGFMDAMVMTYKLKDPNVVSELHPGDRITATLLARKTPDGYTDAMLDQICLLYTSRCV